VIIVADTSALFAAFDAAQPEHGDAVEVMEHELLVVSPMVLTELDHLVHRAIGWHAAMQVMEALQDRISGGRYKLADLRPADLVTAHDVRLKYEALRLDLADAVGVVLADRHRTDRIFTLDQRDFRAITPLTPGFQAFRLIPADTSG
jgi:uncharacterized protein